MSRAIASTRFYTFKFILAIPASIKYIQSIIASNAPLEYFLLILYLKAKATEVEYNSLCKALARIKAIFLFYKPSFVSISY